MQLFMASTQTVAMTTFTPSRTGRFRLQADVGRWALVNGYEYEGSTFEGVPKIHAAIKVGDAEEIALGAVQRNYQRMDTMTWPEPFTIADTNVTVTLVVSNSVSAGAAMLDNFAFLPYQDETELVTDGGFETGEGWTLAAPERNENSDIYKYCSARRVAYAGDPQFYGYARYAGDYRLLTI